MTITLTIFADSPDKGQGMARDMRARWALEEVGLPYDVRPLSFAQIKEAANLARQPFGQIPTLTDGPLTLFESGAIVQHIAHRGPGLLPDDPVARERAAAWLIAALSSVEPVITAWEAAGYEEASQPWHAARLPIMEARIRDRLDRVAGWLGARDWLEGAFSMGDLMMIDVLRRLTGDPLLTANPTLQAYVARGEARPAFRRAWDAQHQFWAAAQAKG